MSEPRARSADGLAAHAGTHRSAGGRIGRWPLSAQQLDQLRDELNDNTELARSSMRILLEQRIRFPGLPSHDFRQCGIQLPEFGGGERVHRSFTSSFRARPARARFAALAFSSSLGLGVAFSIIPMFIYQGGISLLASQVQAVTTSAMMTEMTATGGVILLAIAVSGLLELRKIRTANFLPALLVAPVVVAILAASGLTLNLP